MSTLRANSIEHTDGGPIALTKQSCIVAYAMVQQTSTGHPTQVSFNVSSTTDNGNGLTGITYTNTLSVAKHCVTFAENNQSMSGNAGGINSNGNYQGGHATQQKRTAGCGLDCRQYDNTNRDKDDASIMSAGDLA